MKKIIAITGVLLIAGVLLAQDFPHRTNTQRDNISAPRSGAMNWSATDSTAQIYTGAAWKDILYTDGNGSALTSLNASNLGSGTVPDARFPATLPAVSGANLTAINATNISSGTLANARLDANLQTYANITPSANIQTLLGSADYSAARTNLGLAIGTDVQAYDADLTTWAGLTPSAFFQTLPTIASAQAFRAATKAWPIYNVTDAAYGATAGDTTDDRAAIQLAIDAAHAAGGGTVYLPPGEFYLRAKLKLYTGVTLRGEGPVSVLKADPDNYNTTDPDTSQNFTSMVEVYHQTVPTELIHHSTRVTALKMIGLRGEAKADELYGWHGMFETYGNIVDHCIFEEFGNVAGAIDASNSYNNLLTDNICRNCEIGIGLTGSEYQRGNVVAHNNIYDCRIGITMNYPHQVIIAHNSIRGALNGIQCGGSWQSIGGVEIAGNSIQCVDPDSGADNNSAVGIYIGSGDSELGYCTNFDIHDNTVSGSGTNAPDAITIHRLHRSFVHHNTLLLGTHVIGIAVRGAATDVILEANNISEGDYGIFLSNAGINRTTIRDNFFYSQSTNSVLISSGTGAVLEGNDVSQSAAVTNSGTGTVIRDVAGVRAVAAGGTGITSFGTGVAAALGQNVTGSGALVLGTSPTLATPTISGGAVVNNGSTGAGFVDFYEDSDNGSNRIRLIGPATTGDITLTLPDSDGDADQVLKTDGSGNLSWTDQAGGMGSGDIDAVGDVTSGAAFTGSAGTQLVFNNAGGDGTLAYDGTNFTFTHGLDVTTDIAAVGAISAGSSLIGDGLYLRDASQDHKLYLEATSELSADRTLQLILGDANRSLTLSGSPTLGDWFDQDVKTSAAPQFSSVELGHASDTTISRASAGVMQVEGVAVPTVSSTSTLTNKTIDGASNTIVLASSMIFVVTPGTDLETGDGKAYFPIPASLNGRTINAVRAFVTTAGTTGTTDIQLARIRTGSAADILSTKMTIDSTEVNTDTAATPAAINTSNDDLATDDLIRVDIDAVSTTAPKGLFVIFTTTP